MDVSFGNKVATIQDAETLQEAAEHVAKELAMELRAAPERTGLPTVHDFDRGHDKIFATIESGNHAEVRKYLAERGHKVQITPKIGCSHIHYSKLNVANYQNENEDSLLIKAAQVDCKMVEIILEYGGNPNHANKDRDTPLSIAADRGDKDSIDVLLRAGGNLRAAVVKLTSSLRYVSEEQLKRCAQVGFSVRPLTVLLAEDVYLKCRDPIQTAFDVCKEIKRIKDVRNEFEIEFEMMMKDSDLFVYKFLNHCEDMSEAREILTSSSNLLRAAIDQNKKSFVSHPFIQQIINERWYGETSNRLFFGKTLIALKYFTSFIMLPLLFLKFLIFDLCKGARFMESPCSDLLTFLSTPCLCFVTDAINYIGFLAVLISCCLIPFGEATYEVIVVEFVLYYCVFARILIEVDSLIQQGWRPYFYNFWNCVDIMAIATLVAAAFYKGTIEVIVDKQEENYKDNEGEFEDFDRLEETLINQHRNSMNVNYMYAVAEFILVIRFMSLLESTKSMGTMLIALKYLVVDVIKFGVILLMVILGTSISIYSMTIALNEWNNELDNLMDDYNWPVGYPKRLPDVRDEANEIKIPKEFKTFTDTLRNILWSTFGLLDVVVGHLYFYLIYIFTKYYYMYVTKSNKVSHVSV